MSAEESNIRIVFEQISRLDPAHKPMLSGKEFEVTGIVDNLKLQTADGQEIKPKSGSVYQVTKYKNGEKTEEVIAAYTDKYSHRFSSMRDFRKALSNCEVYNATREVADSAAPPLETGPFIKFWC